MASNFPNNILRFILLCALIVTPLLGAGAQTIRIMPMGNSITAGGMCTNGDIHSCVPLGGNVAVGYRQKLFNRLTSAGYDFDFVGSETFGNSIMSDSDCAGFGGIRDSQLADIMETGTSSHTGYVSSGPYLNSHPADIVLLHVGTNDVLGADTAWTDIPRILNAIDDYESAYNTTVTVFLARIISTRYAACWTNPRVIAYNRLIDNLAASRIAAGDQLILVDMECGAGIDYNNDFTDQVHPNQSGYDKMGEAWFAAIEAWSPTPNPTYSLTVNSPIGNGTTSPAEGLFNYVQGSTVNVTATASAGYVFTQWSGDLTGNTNPASLLMDGNKSIGATFEQRSYDLTVTTDGTTGALVDPAGSLSVGHGFQTSISVTSVPEGSSFNGWEVISGSSVTIADQSSQSTTVKLESGDATIRANFTSVTHKVSIDITGEGSVGKTPDLEDYPKNSVVTLTAIPGSGYRFVRWTGDVTGTSNPSDLLMNGEKGLRATFQQTSYSLSVSSDGTTGAVLDPAGTFMVDHGVETALSVTTVPEGSTFYGWEVISGSMVTIADPSSLNTTVKLESGDASVRANFAPFSHQLTITVSGEGSVDKTPDLAEYPHSSVVTLTATPATGYQFVGWTGDLAGSNNPSDLVMDGNKNITATFETVTLTHFLATSVVGQGSVGKSPDLEEYPHNSTITLSATPADGYRFIAWTGDLVGSNNPSDLVMDGNKDITATFEKRSYDLTVNTDGTDGAEVDPAGTISVDHGEKTIVSVSRVPTGHKFNGWETVLGSSVTITDPSAQTTGVTLESGNATIRATFADSTTLGTINGDSETGRLVVFPNPAGDHIFLSHRTRSFVSGRILVSDMKGKQVISQAVEEINPGKRINISTLSPGIYMVHWILDTGEVLKGKFVKLD